MHSLMLLACDSLLFSYILYQIYANVGEEKYESGKPSQAIFEQ